MLSFNNIIHIIILIFIGKIGCVALKDRDFRKIPLKRRWPRKIPSNAKALNETTIPLDFAVMPVNLDKNTPKLCIFHL